MGLSGSYSSSNIDVISSSAKRLVKIINESLTIANESNNPETKISRLSVAKDNLSKIEELCKQHSFLTLTSLGKVEASIAELEKEFAIAGYEEIVNGNISAEALEKEGKIEEAIVTYEELASRDTNNLSTPRHFVSESEERIRRNSYSSESP